jgi:exodeoxyribonuclease VII large subunit
VLDRQSLIEQTQGLWQRGQRAIERRLQNDAQRLDRWQRDLLSAHGWLERWRWAWQTMQQRFVQAVLHEQRLRQQRLHGFTQALHLLNPQQVLERGYSIVLNEAGQVVSSAAQTVVGAGLQVQFAQGRVATTVTQVTSPVAK